MCAPLARCVPVISPALSIVAGTPTRVNRVTYHHGVWVSEALFQHSAEMPAKVARPWGSYETIANGPRFQVKRIIVDPGERLSLQSHVHRSEHWVVVRGAAEVTVGDQVSILQENESTYIEAGTRHRLANPGKVPLELIEVQCGSYLGEDDITRFDDQYGRANK